jgi:hypothetical protein
MRKRTKRPVKSLKTKGLTGGERTSPGGSLEPPEVSLVTHIGKETIAQYNIRIGEKYQPGICYNCGREWGVHSGCFCYSKESNKSSFSKHVDPKTLWQPEDPLRFAVRLAQEQSDGKDK